MKKELNGSKTNTKTSCFAFIPSLVYKFKILTLVCSLFQAFQSNERHSSGSKTNTYLKYSQKGRLHSDQEKPEWPTHLLTKATPVSRETLPLPAVETWTDGATHHFTSQKKSIWQAASGERSLPFSGGSCMGLDPHSFTYC